MIMLVITENSPMPYGKYKGKKIKDLPADYLLWLYYNNRAIMAIRSYVGKHIRELEQQALEEM